MFNLPLAAVDVVLTDLRLGPLGYPFEIPATDPGLRDTVWADLERHRFAYSGSLEPHVEEVLVTVARPAIRIDLFGYLSEDDPDGGLVRARGAGNGRSGVIAVQEGGVVRFTETDDLAEGLVGLLPQRSRGTARPVRFPGGVPEDELTGPHAAAAQAMRRVLTEPRVAAGCFACRYRDRDGENLTWLDTTSGRYAMQDATARDGQRWVGMVPADPSIVEDWIRECIEGRP